MNWEDFQKHPSVVNTVEDFGKPAGQLLFGILLHRMIAHLNGYKEWVKLINSFAIGQPLMRIEGSIPNISTDIQSWYSKWNPYVENWLSDLFTLQKRFIVPKLQEEINWHKLIINLPAIPDGIHQQYTEAQTLTIPTEELPRDFVENAIGCIEIVTTVCRKIENEKYLCLWRIDRED